MSLRPTYFFLTALLALSACSAGKTAAAPASGCNAAAVQNLISQPADAALQQKAQAAASANSVRTLGPNDAATMDFNPQRLNIYTDTNKMVVRIACG